MEHSGPTFLNLLASELVEGSSETVKSDITITDWTPNNVSGIFEDQEVLREPTSLENCDEGCTTECYDANMLYSPKVVYQVCKIPDTPDHASALPTKLGIMAVAVATLAF